MRNLNLETPGWILLAALGFIGVHAAESQTVNSTDATRVQHLEAEAARQLVEQKRIVVLDIRTPEEFRAGHITGARNIDFRAHDFEKQIAVLPKDGAYLLHCASGNRSTQSLPTFSKLDFKSVCHLDGGIKAWQKAKLPVE